MSHGAAASSRTNSIPPQIKKENQTTKQPNLPNEYAIYNLIHASIYILIRNAYAHFNNICDVRHHTIHYKRPDSEILLALWKKTIQSYHTIDVIYRTACGTLSVLEVFQVMSSTPSTNNVREYQVIKIKHSR